MRITIDSDKRKFFEKKVWRSTRKAFVKCRQALVDHSGDTDPERLKLFSSYFLDIKPMTEHINQVWGDIGGRYGYDTEKKLKSLKSKTPEMELKADAKKLTEWKEKMKKYSAERSLAKVKAIMTTEQEAINRVIDSVIQESLDQGLGIIETRRLLTHDLSGEKMLEMENWQAQRIAMTEVGSAQNTGSFEAAQENSEGVKKVWLFIPGKKTFREEHAAFGAEDDSTGGRGMDEEYAPGLQYPGDPNGTAEEIINCYCTIGYEVE